MSYASALSAAFLAASAPQVSIEGDWLTANGNAVVRVAPCGAHLCGTVVRVLARGPGIPRTDVRNPDPSLRSRPLLGLPVLTGFTREGGEWTGGHAYDANTGKSYKSKLALTPDGKLTITGCIVFLCKSQQWTRVR